MYQAELSARGSPAVAELPFSPAPHTDVQARLKKTGKTLHPGNADKMKELILSSTGTDS